MYYKKTLQIVVLRLFLSYIKNHLHNPKIHFLFEIFDKIIIYNNYIYIIIIIIFIKNHLHNPKIHFLFEIFDKIIIPICDYGYEVGIFLKAPAIEGVHLEFFLSEFYMLRNILQFFLVHSELGKHVKMKTRKKT